MAKKKSTETTEEVNEVLATAETAEETTTEEVTTVEETTETVTVDIEEETEASEVKANEVESETDTDTATEEADNIEELKLTIYGHTYGITQLLSLLNQETKTYTEKEISKKFVLLMYNYYRAIKHAVLRDCCGHTYTLQDVKNKLANNSDLYDTVYRRCSRSSIKFDKTTVDIIINFIEEYENK